MPENINEQLNIADAKGGKNNKDGESSRPSFEISSTNQELSKTADQLNEFHTKIAGDKQVDAETLQKIREQILAMQNEPKELQLKTAEKILGKDVLGPKAIETAFGFKLEAKDIPNIPFGKADLARAKELKQFLILRINQAPDGQPLTMQKMNEIKGGKTKDGGKVLADIRRDEGYEDQAFFATETPSLGWALVSKEVIPNSIKQGYLEQTENMIDYLQNKVFVGQKLDKVYQDAITEFNKEKDDISYAIHPRRFEREDSVRGAEKLAKLKINNLLRQTPVEALYDILLMKEQNNEYILPNSSTWTNGQHSRTWNSGGWLMCVGGASGEGVRIAGYLPGGGGNKAVGVAFSRSR